MDGLLAPCYPDGPVLEVPFLGADHTTHGLAQRSLDREPPSAQNLRDWLQSLEPGEQAAHAQSRIFFDLLIRQSLEGLLRDGDFTTYNANDRPTIMVKPVTISRAVLEWNAKLASSSERQRVESFRSMRTILEVAESQCDHIDYPATSQKVSHEWKIYGVVLLSIRLLIDYLHSALEIAERTWHLTTNLSARMDYRRLGREGYHELTRKARTYPMARALPPGGCVTMASSIVLDLFELNGWCAVQAQRLCQRTNYAEAVSLSYVRSATTNRGHATCSYQGRCVAFDLSQEEEDAYASTHTHQHDCDANCGMLGGSLTAQLHKIVKSGRMPIMSMDPSAPDLDLQISVNDGTRPYTAVSHVWSDGLGNPHGNELSHCKLEILRGVLRNTKAKREMMIPRLERFHANIENAMLFPMTRNRKTKKKKAMRHITPIFQSAEQVVILDAGLKEYKPKSQESVWDAPFRENIIAHMLASKWSTRAWTLEEGALARNCLVQLDGDLVSLDQITRSEVDWFLVQTNKLWKKQIDAGQIIDSTLFQISLNSTLADALNDPRKRAFRLGNSSDTKRNRAFFQETRPSQFIAAWNELLRRSSTKPDDRVLIMANILDFDVERLSTLHAEHRLPLLVESCDEIPVSLMFNSKCDPTRTVHPCRAWLPTSIHGDYLASSATIDMRGFRETGRCTFSSHSKSLICIKFDFLIPHGTMNFCTLDEEQRPRFIVEVLHGDKTPARDEPYYSAGSSTFLMIDTATGTNSLNGYTGRGARFSNRSTEREHVLLGFNRPLKVWSMEQWMYKTGHQPCFTTYEGVMYKATTGTLELEMPPSEHVRLIQRQPLSPSLYYRATKLYRYASIMPSLSVATLLFLLITEVNLPKFLEEVLSDNMVRHFVIAPITAVAVFILGLPVLAVLIYCQWWYDRMKYSRWVSNFISPSDDGKGSTGCSTGTNA